MPRCAVPRPACYMPRLLWVRTIVHCSAASAQCINFDEGESFPMSTDAFKQGFRAIDHHLRISAQKHLVTLTRRALRRSRSDVWARAVPG